jgi:hypothetical protein
MSQELFAEALKPRINKQEKIRKSNRERKKNRQEYLKSSYTLSYFPTANAREVKETSPLPLF